MKKLLFIIVLLFVRQVAAQSIVQMEYCIDTDPGFGNATPISFTPGSTADVSFTADLSSTSSGIHQLFVRAKDDSGRWSQTFSKPFLKGTVGLATLPDVVRLEYYVDIDPGYGNATPVSIPSSTDIDKSFAVDLSALSAGFHIVGIRAMDETGAWSLVTTRPLLKGDGNAVTEDITAIEYYIDADPGYGNGTPVTLTVNPFVDTSFAANLSSISTGFHMLGIRAKDSNGAWGLVTTRPFLKGQHNVVYADIVRVEYYIDKDPGYGQATTASITNASAVDTNFVANLDTLGNGFHILGVRALDNRGAWSHTYTKPFLRSESNTIAANIIQLEYFIDNDPGYGAATGITVVAGNFVDTSYNADLSSIATGFHMLGIRAKDDNNIWGLTNTRPFLKGSGTSAPGLVRLEYFVDTDPGFSNGLSVTLNHQQFDDTTYTADLSGVPLGQHLLYMRAYDELGAWSHTYIDSIEVFPCVNPEIYVSIISDTLCANTTVLFSDSTTRTGAGTQYFWDFNNDGIVDDTTRGSVTFMYDTVGTYTAKLLIKNAGGSCSDSVMKTIIIVGPPNAHISSMSATSFCVGDSVVLVSDSTTAYLWSTGDTTRSIVVKNSGTYYLTVTNSYGCSGNIDSMVVVVNSAPVNISITALSATTFCDGDSVVLRCDSIGKYLWSTGDTTQSITARVAGVYNVTLTNAFGCSAAGTSVNINVLPLPAKPVITQHNDTLICSTAITYQWFLNDEAILGETQQAYIVSKNGAYTVRITDTTGCSNVSDTVFVNLIGISSLNGNINKISISPNPYTDEALLSFNLVKAGVVSAELYDLLGKRVSIIINNSLLNKGTYNYLIDNNLSGGVYMLRINVNNHSTAYRVVKE